MFFTFKSINFSYEQKPFISLNQQGEVSLRLPVAQSELSMFNNIKISELDVESFGFNSMIISVVIPVIVISITEEIVAAITEFAGMITKHLKSEEPKSIQMTKSSIILNTKFPNVSLNFDCLLFFPSACQSSFIPYTRHTSPPSVCTQYLEHTRLISVISITIIRRNQAIAQAYPIS